MNVQPTEKKVDFVKYESVFHLFEILFHILKMLDEENHLVLH